MSPHARGSIVVFAKRPVPGQVKTRLCPPFSPEQAADFYAAMLDDVLETTAELATGLGLDPLLAVWPPDAAPVLAARAPAAYAVVPQRGGDLAARMEHACAAQWAEGRLRVLLRGSDSPVLDREVFAGAVAALEDRDLVLCPDLDGGYNLVGLARPAPGLFDHPMSTERVLDETLAGARRRGLSAQLLEPRFDLDTAADLALLARAREAGRAGRCPRTLAWLDAAGPWPLTQDPPGALP